MTVARAVSLVAALGLAGSSCGGDVTIAPSGAPKAAAESGGTVPPDAHPGGAGVPSLETFAEHWMGYSQVYLQDLTVFDMSLPGTHDTLTYDLSLILSRSEDVIADPLADVINYVEKHFAGIGVDLVSEFIRDQAQSQSLTLTEQLDAGIRFLDLRWSHEADGWYAYHTLISNQQASVYLAELEAWLTAHPSEMVVAWMSHHGSTTAVDQYDATQAQYTAFGDSIEGLFGTKLVNPSTDGHPAETTYGQYQAKKKQLVLYVSDYAKLGIAGSLNADPTNGGGIFNKTVPNLQTEPESFEDQLSFLKSGQSIYSANKAKKTYVLRGGATEGTTGLLTAQAELHFLDVSTDIPPAYSFLQSCKEQFQLPTPARAAMGCPSSLEELGRLMNYYYQRPLDFALAQITANPSGSPYRLPMAIYIDGVGPAGTLLTGTSTDPTTGTYPYLGALLKSTMARTKCSTTPGSFAPAATCAVVDQLVEGLLNASPPVTQSDFATGRAANWPPVPDAMPGCALGYVQAPDGNCYLAPYVQLQSNECEGDASCSAPDSGMCPDGWEGHCHGDCDVIAISSCRNDCLAGGSAAEKQRISGPGTATDPLFHTITDLSKYYICGLNGQWMGISSASQQAFNTGGGHGSRDPFSCIYPVGGCAPGYRETTGGDCYIQPYVALQGNECGGLPWNSHCSAKSGACTAGYVGHSHGKCDGTCRNDCVVNTDSATISSGSHSIKDVSKYYVCSVSGNWVTFSQAQADPAEVSFNNGTGAGDRNPFTCMLQ